MIYVVQKGDSLYSIARRYGVTVENLIYDNQLNGLKNLVVGQALLIRIPGETNASARNLFVNGYAYTNVNPGILAEALPAIQELLIFSYGFTEEGELVPPPLNDLPLIETAWQSGVEPKLVLTPFDKSGQFNNNLISALTEDTAVQERLISELLATVQEKGYNGVDVDFEYIRPENRESYAAFVGRLREAMNAQGFTVSVALAPKESAEQRGLLYEGLDYRSLGENADSVFLMTYEWGYTYGPPMAVAPLNKVRQVVEYALTEIPEEKIVMGIPNYAYDWQLPFERGVSRARTIGNIEAVRIAAENNAQILYDETAQSPHFNYWKDGIQHEVWFEDVRSIQAKLNLAEEYGLLGVGYWNLMRPFRPNWLLLEDIQRT